MRCAAEQQERNVKYLEVHRGPADIRDMSEAYVLSGVSVYSECYSPVSLSKMNE